MAFWNRRERRSTSGLRFPHDWLTDSLAGPVSHAGTRVTVDSALGLAPVWAAVSLISEQLGQLPFKVYRTLDEDVREEARGHRAWRLLHDRPNSHTPASRFWATVGLHLLLYGNAFIEKRRDTFGIVDELWLLPPSEVTVKWWPNLREKTYVHTPNRIISSQVGGRDVRSREFDDDDVLHIFKESLDGIVGMSVISTCKASLGVALAREEFEGEFYANGAVLSQAFTMEGRIKSDDALKRFKESAKALFTGSGRRHQVGVFEDGVKPIPIGSPLKDLEFVASQNMSRTDIAVMFKLPPNKLGGSSGEGLTYSTVEMNQTAIAVDAVAPLAGTIADFVSQDPGIMPQNVHHGEFVLEGMMRGDAAARSEFYERMVGIKAMLPDEVRERENLPLLTAAQKRELNPPAPAQRVLPGMEPAAVNGNGNGRVADDTGATDGP